jgi:hypothetical protein
MSILSQLKIRRSQIYTVNKFKFILDSIVISDKILYGEIFNITGRRDI